MSFVIPVNVLKNAIKLLRKITPRSSNLPILRCLLFHPRKGCVSATDLEQSLTVKLEGEGKAEPFIIDLKELADFIKPVRGNGDIVFTPDMDGRVEIKLPDGEALNVSTMALCEWPEPMECKGKSTKIEVDSGFFDLFRKAASLVSKDVTRFAMQHVCMDENNLAGGDGHRLAHFAHGLDVPMKLVVPSTKLLKSKDVFGNATLTLYGKNPKVCKIATEEFTYIVKLCESAYPNYEQVMPRPDPEDRVVELDSTRLDDIRTSLKEFESVDGIPSVGLLAGACGFHLIDDGKTPKTITPQAEVTGPKENLLCSINRDYLEEALACGFDHIAFHNPLTSMRFFSDVGRMVVMPLRNHKRTVKDALKLIGAPPVKKESKQTEQPKEMIEMPKENDTQVAKPNLTVVDKPKTVDPMEELLAFSTELAEQARDLSNKVRELPKKIRAAKADLKNKDKAFNEARKAMESFQKAAGF